METWVDNIQEILGRDHRRRHRRRPGLQFPQRAARLVRSHVRHRRRPRARHRAHGAGTAFGARFAAVLGSCSGTPKTPGRGRFHNGPTGWVVSDHNVTRLRTYGLDQYYDVFYPGSQAALDTSIMRAYERGEPWLGYYWEPTWIMGSLDMTMLEEPPYTPECWAEGTGDYGSRFRRCWCASRANHRLLDRAPLCRVSPQLRNGAVPHQRSAGVHGADRRRRLRRGSLVSARIRRLVDAVAGRRPRPPG